MRIAQFRYKIKEIQIWVEPQYDLKVMCNELRDVIDTILMDNPIEPECVKIYFAYGFSAEEALFFINANEDALNWLRYRNLDPVDYLTESNYLHLKGSGKI